MTACSMDRPTTLARPELCLGLAHESSEVRRVLGTAAREHGFGVIEAARGAELVEQLADWTVAGGRKPDVLVLGSRLRCSEIIGSLRGTAWAAPTIVIAGSEEERAWMAVPGSDVRAVMVWPFDPDDFVTVARFLARRGLHERNAPATTTA